MWGEQGVRREIREGEKGGGRERVNMLIVETGGRERRMRRGGI